MSQKIDHNPVALKNIRESFSIANDGKMTQSRLAEEMNRMFEAHSIPDGLIQKQIADLETGHCNLSLVRGLAIARVLNTTFSELLHEELLQLGPLENRLLDFATADAAGRFFLEAETEGRVVILSDFPCSIFLDVPSHNRQQTKRATAIERARFAQLLQAHTQSQEFYFIDKVIEFSFSPFSPFSSAEKIAVLDRLIELFSGNHNDLYYIKKLSYPCSTPNLMFSRMKRVVYLPLSCRFFHFLEIRNPVLYERLLGLFYKGYEADLSGAEESIELLKKIKILLSVDAPLLQQVRALYTESSSKLQALMHEALKPLL